MWEWTDTWYCDTTPCTGPSGANRVLRGGSSGRIPNPCGGEVPGDLVAPPVDLVAPRRDLVALFHGSLSPPRGLTAPRGDLVAPRRGLVAPRGDLVAPRSSLGGSDAGCGRCGGFVGDAARSRGLPQARIKGNGGGDHARDDRARPRKGLGNPMPIRRERNVAASIQRVYPGRIIGKKCRVADHPYDAEKYGALVADHP